jgi:hypothetical protein
VRFGAHEAGDAEEQAAGSAGVAAAGFLGVRVRAAVDGVGLLVVFVRDELVGERADDGGERRHRDEPEVEHDGLGHAFHARASLRGHEPEREIVDGRLVVDRDVLERGAGAREFFEDVGGAGGVGGEHFKVPNYKGSNGQRKRRRDGETERETDSEAVRR